MEIEKTAISREIQYVMSGMPTVEDRSYTAFIHLMDKNINIRALKLTSLDIDREYTNNIGDVIIAELAIPVGTYADVVYPNKANAEVTIITTSNTLLKKTQKPTSVRYKAIFKDTGKPRLQANKSTSHSTDILDLSNFVTVKVQLTPISTYILRTAQVGGIFRFAKPEDVLKSLITSQVQLIESDQKEAITGVDLVTPDNSEEVEQLVIPHGTPLVSVPQFIQKRVCGVYNSGLSSYVQDGTWYIFPTFNKERNTSTGKTVSLILLPKNKYPGLTHTYRQRGDQTVILTTGDVNQLNTNKEDQMNQGSGVRFLNAETVFSDEGINREGNKAKISRSNMNTEIIAHEQTDGLNNVPVSTTSITSNPFEEYSKLAKNSGGYLQVVWENSNPDLIHPGMMASLTMATNNGKVITAYGVIHGATHNTRLARPGIVDSKYITTTALNIHFDHSQFLE